MDLERRSHDRASPSGARVYNAFVSHSLQHGGVPASPTLTFLLRSPPTNVKIEETTKTIINRMSSWRNVGI